MLYLASYSSNTQFGGVCRALYGRPVYESNEYITVVSQRFWSPSFFDQLYSVLVSAHSAASRLVLIRGMRAPPLFTLLTEPPRAQIVKKVQYAGTLALFTSKWAVLGPFEAKKGAGAKGGQIWGAEPPNFQNLPPISARLAVSRLTTCPVLVPACFSGALLIIRV